MSVLINPREYISSEELRQNCPKDFDYQEWLDFVDRLPKADVVSRELFDQIKWELSAAISQLKDLGYNFLENPIKENKQ